jgi:hypothetical protein
LDLHSKGVKGSIVCEFETYIYQLVESCMNHNDFIINTYLSIYSLLMALNMAPQTFLSY